MMCQLISADYFMLVLEERSLEFEFRCSVIKSTLSVVYFENGQCVCRWTTGPLLV